MTLFRIQSKTIYIHHGYICLACLLVASDADSIKLARRGRNSSTSLVIVAPDTPLSPHVNDSLLGLSAHTATFLTRALFEVSGFSITDLMNLSFSD